MNPLTHSFVPIAFMIFMSVMTGLGVLFLSWLLSGRRSSQASESIYECGLDPMDAPTKRFSIDFHVVALLFILFDVEVALLLPWAVYFSGVADTSWKMIAFIDFLVFIAILVVGYVYLYRAGAFDWSRSLSERRAEAEAAHQQEAA
ncbi:MAG: NADH-quinone oxidoreductase subunit A [Acidobacteriota bacterium]